MKPRGFRFDILYGLCKIHKSSIENFSSFRSILSAIKTLSYNLAKLLVPILEPITTNRFTIKNSFELAKESFEKGSGLFMASLYANSLFLTAPSEEGKNICCNSLFENGGRINDFNRSDFGKILRAALENNFFTFDGKTFKQIELTNLVK